MLQCHIIGAYVICLWGNSVFTLWLSLRCRQTKEEGKEREWMSRQVWTANLCVGIISIFTAPVFWPEFTDWVQAMWTAALAYIRSTLIHRKEQHLKNMLSVMLGSSALFCIFLTYICCSLKLALNSPSLRSSLFILSSGHGGWRKGLNFPENKPEIGWFLLELQ